MFSREWHSLPADVQKKIEAYQQEEPMRLADLAREIGLIVKASTLPVGISGEIKPDPQAEAKFLIRINRHEHKSRQRFTLAHELAHFFLHKDEIKSGIQDNVLYRSSLSDKREAEANRLAADMLMPWSLLERKLEQYKNVSLDEKIDNIAADLGVSSVAIKIRLGVN